MSALANWRLLLSRSNINNTLALWRNVWSVLWESGPWLTAAVAAATLAEALLSIGSLYALKLLVDAIGAGLLNPDAVRSVYASLLVAGVALVSTVAAQSLANYLRTRQGLLVGDIVDRKIHTRAIAVDLSFYESPRYLDSLQKAREAGTQRPAQVVGNVVSLTRGGIILSAVLVMLAAIEWRLLPALLLTVGAALLVRLYFTRKQFIWRMARAQLERRAGYLDWMLTSNVHAKELRLNRLGAHFASLYGDLRTTIRTEHLQLERRRLLAETAVALFATVVFVGVAAYLIALSLKGTLTIGQVVLFVLLLRRAEAAGADAVSGLSRLVDDHQYLGRLFDFLGTPETIGLRVPHAQPSAIPPRPLEDGIRLENVSFTYPGAISPAVRDITLHVPLGKIVAVVGENGSGKTTLIKLLTRLYDPTGGRVLLEGRDVREFDPVRYRSLFSVIFQDFAMYPETVRENIRFGDVDLTNGAMRAEQAAREGGATSFVERLPKGFETPLTKLFDNGHDLSLGQWQRLALSRAFFPDSQFIIMDEPTSAVDPAAEFQLFENFRERLAGRSALVISHRLSTVRQADYTYVLNHGEIMEGGRHDELMAADGRYAKLFEQQARSYRCN